MDTKRHLTIAFAALMPLALVLAGCPDKPDDTAPSAAPPPPPPPPPPTATASASAAPEEIPDAGADADADAGDAGKKVYKSNVSGCCAAIRQNRASAPPTQWPLYDAAIAMCSSGAIPPAFKNLAQCR